VSYGRTMNKSNPRSNPGRGREKDPAEKTASVTTPIQASLACEPSQNGGVAVRLHMHQATRFFSVMTTFTGLKPLSLCAPSQNGCVEE